MEQQRLSTIAGEPNEVDKAASAACIRSGAFALLLSVVLFLLIPYWKNESNYVALRKYVTDRLNLADALDTLDDSVLWQKYKESHESTESMSLTQLQAARAELSIQGTAAPATATTPERSPHARDASKPRRALLKGPPEPPTNVSVKAVEEMEIGELSQIAQHLKSLNDSDTLTRTRRVPNFSTCQSCGG